MVRKRKRAPGGGRKPDPNKKVLFTIRLEPHLLAELKAHAQTWQGGKGNVSAFTESLINKGLRERVEERRDPALRGLLYLIGQLAESMSGGYFMPKEYRPQFISQWRTDPFRFRAFKLAVRKLLDALEEPPGELNPPPVLPQPIRRGASPLQPQQIEEAIRHTASALHLSPEDLGFILARVHEETKSPENFATLHFAMLWERAINTAPPDEVDRKVFTASFGHIAEREFYGLPKAVRDLELKPKTAKLEGNGND